MKVYGIRSRKRFTIFDIILYAVMLGISYITLYPFLMVVFTSISDPTEVLRNPVFLYPRSLTFVTYKLVINEMTVLRGFKNSVIYTATYTLLLVLFTTAAAYPLSVKAFRARKFLLKMFLIPWFFSGGLIPTYIIVDKLGLVNTMWAVILPGMVGVYNLILIRTFIEQLPGELLESAIIDGANHVHVFFKLIVPLSMPIIATISLWAIVGQWNNYFGPLLYFTDTSKNNLQVVLRELLASTMLEDLSTRARAAAPTIESRAMLVRQLQTDSLKAAVIVISTIPILVVYPFAQKYFVKGIMIGAIKG